MEFIKDFGIKHRDFFHFIGLRVIYLLMAFVCVYYLQYTVLVLYQMMYGWAFIILFSSIQIPFPETKGMMNKLIASTVEIFQNLLIILEIVIESLTKIFQKTPQHNKVKRVKEDEELKTD